MATETVETKKVVTEEEELTLCDNCCREVDEDGEEYTPEEDGREIHFCSECKVRFTQEDVQPDEIKRVEDWLKAHRPVEDGETVVSIEESIFQVRNRTVGALFITLFLLVVSWSSIATGYNMAGLITTYITFAGFIIYLGLSVNRAYQAVRKGVNRW